MWIDIIYTIEDPLGAIQSYVMHFNTVRTQW